MKKFAFPVTNIGSASLLMTFIVLCLVTFSTLSLSGSLSEYRYSRKLAEHNLAYYNASNRAVLMLREVDDILNTAYSKNRDSYYSDAREAFAHLENVATDFSMDTPTITYETPINDTQSLQVVLSLNRPENLESGYYRIVSWKETASAEWKGDDHLDLMMPDAVSP